MVGTTAESAMVTNEGTTFVNLYGIGDLHLPGGQDKPMDVFGDAWADHPERIRQNWLATVGEDDIVLVPGDLSWAMTLAEAEEDLAYLGSLPGTVLLIRGNHDYWWQAIGKVRRALPPGVYALQNDHFALPGRIAVCGTRGWDLPGTDSDPHDVKVYQREVLRLEMSLQSARAAGLEPKIAMLHYPPTTNDGRPTPMTDLLEAYGVSLCVYGHLHGQARRFAVSGTVRGVRYQLVACDAIGFAPLHLARFPVE